MTQLNNIERNVEKPSESLTNAMSDNIPNWDVIAPIIIGLWIAFILAMLGYASVYMTLDYWLLSTPEPVFKT